MPTLEELLKEKCGKYSEFKGYSRAYLSDQNNPEIIRKLLEGEPQHVIDDIINHYSPPAFRDYVDNELGDRVEEALLLLKDNYQVAVGLVDKSHVIGVLGRLPPPKPKDTDSEEAQKLYKLHVQYFNLQQLLEKESLAVTDAQRAEAQNLKAQLYPALSGASENVMRLVAGYVGKLSPEALKLRYLARKKELEGELIEYFSREAEKDEDKFDDAAVRAYITQSIDATPEKERAPAFLALAEYLR